MFGKLLRGLTSTVGGVVNGIIGGLCDDVNRSTGSSYIGPAAFTPCGICGMSVPRDAQKCPYCHEHPSCR